MALGATVIGGTSTTTGGTGGTTTVPSASVLWDLQLVPLADEPQRTLALNNGWEPIGGVMNAILFRKPRA